MITAIGNSTNVSSARSAVPGPSRAARPLRVVTNASLGACEKLRGLGYVVQSLDVRMLDGESASAIDADIIIVDRNVTALWSPLNAGKIKAPVVFINGPASPQADYGADVIKQAGDASSSLGALQLAANFTDPDEAEEGLTCGNLSLRNSRAFWNGVDLVFTIGEYRIVELLASRPGHYFTYRAIYDRLRHEGFIAGDGERGHWANVRSAIKRIRGKLRALDAGFDEIQNYAAVGYCWRKPA